MKSRKQKKAEKFQKKVNNLNEAATEWNKKTPAQKKAARKWGGNKDGRN